MKKCKIAIIVLFLLFVSFVCCYYSFNHCYGLAKKQTGLSVFFHKDDTIRIAYLGDSWAYNHKEMKCVIDSIIHAQIGKPVQLKNAGVGGLVSKEIYNGIFTNTELKSAIEWGPNFCFVSAGINDCNKKVGSDIYKENMRLLISLLLENHITPVILEIPYYDIYYTFWNKTFISMFRDILSLFWTRSAINFIDSYSNAYNDLVNEQQWHNKVITIRRSYWNPKGYEGQKELYTSDRIHVNQDGYFVLDSCITSQIVRFLKHRNISNNN